MSHTHTSSWEWIYVLCEEVWEQEGRILYGNYKQEKDAIAELKKIKSSSDFPDDWVEYAVSTPVHYHYAPAAAAVEGTAWENRKSLQVFIIEKRRLY